MRECGRIPYSCIKLSFDNPNRLEEARDSLDMLIHGDEKTAAFLAKFRALQVEARFTVNEFFFFFF